MPWVTSFTFVVSILVVPYAAGEGRLDALSFGLVAHVLQPGDIAQVEDRLAQTRTVTTVDDNTGADAPMISDGWMAGSLLSWIPSVCWLDPYCPGSLLSWIRIPIVLDPDP